MALTDAHLYHVVGFSGGADSQACALWVRQRYPAEDIILLNSDAGGNEHPLTVAWVQWYSQMIFPVTSVKALVKDLGGRGTRPGATKDRRDALGGDDEELTFDALASVKGIFPSRKAQFCTEHLKLSPQRRWTEENLVDQGLDFERWIGVRRDESQNRVGALEREWDSYFDCYINRPLVGWSKAQVFDFLKRHGEEVNPLYRAGFSRVGCAPCINSGKDDVRLWAARFPEMIDKVRQWEENVGRTFFAPCVPGKEINWVDQVVDWSRTARGGRQTLLPMVEVEADSGSCSSRYGLCE
jgi:3'-phosphoadenosine 5'-phosphosulfate sulfotransferase (PAPS reductase)/FAD synthetase